MYLIQAALDKTATAGQKAQETILNMVSDFWSRLPYVAVGITVFLLFLIIATAARRIARLSITKAGYDPMVASLISRLGYYAILIAGFFVAAVVVFPGLSPGDLVTGLGIGSVALGFAFKDVLQNLFAGFLILIYRPFRIGDQIRIKDFEGIVEEISVRATKITTLDGERVVVPNADLYMNAVLVRTAFESRRSSVTVGIGYGDDHEKARGILLDVVRSTEGVLEEPAPAVRLTELADSSVNLVLLFWTNSDQSSANGAIHNVIGGTKTALDEAGIDIPFPHRVVEMKGEAAS